TVLKGLKYFLRPVLGSFRKNQDRNAHVDNALEALHAFFPAFWIGSIDNHWCRPRNPAKDWNFEEFLLGQWPVLTRYRERDPGNIQKRRVITYITHRLTPRDVFLATDPVPNEIQLAEDP